MDTLASPVIEGARLLRPSRALNTSRSVRSSEVTFVRRVDAPFDTALARLEDWWRVEAREGTVRIGTSRLVVPPAPGEDGDRCRIDVVLVRGGLWAPLPMELELMRWSTAFGTRLELEPLRDVRPHDRYFQAGHGVLDRVAAVLEGRSWS